MKSEMPNINLYNVDCMSFMKGVPDKAYDLAIVDPPYGIGEDGRNNHTRSCLTKAKDFRSNRRYDNEKPTEEYFEELFRVSKNQIIWGANHYGGLPGASGWIIWDKDNGSNDFADCELAFSSFDKAARKFKYRWNGMLQENMKNKQSRIHPNEKPFALYRWLLKNYAIPADKILDTHGGSGSILIAAYDLGYEIDWIEIDEYYFNSAKARYEDHVLKYAPASEHPVNNQGQVKLF